MDQSNVQASELYTLQLPSKQESITLLENLIEEIADKHNVSEDTFANMMTCLDRKSTRLNSSHSDLSRMPSSA